MDIFLERFAGKINKKSILKTIEELKTEYLDDGITKEDFPLIISRLMMETMKFNKLAGVQKKKLVVGILNHFIEQFDGGEKDTEFEVTLKTMVPPIIDGFAPMLKLRNNWLQCLFPKTN